MRSMYLRLLAAPLLLALGIGSAKATTIVISSNPTQNVSCSQGSCVSTGSPSTLNASDLQNLLATGNVSVTTSGGSGSDIKLNAPLTWSSAATLTLQANRNIIVSKTMTVPAAGGLRLTTDATGAGGLLSFINGGNITFPQLTSTLSINGFPYQLAASIADLKNAFAGSVPVYVALAADYDATADGVYSSAPITNIGSGLGFGVGVLEGFGHTISNFKLSDTQLNDGAGLIKFINPSGFIENLNLSNVQISIKNETAGALAAFNAGVVSAVSVSGKVTNNGGTNRAGGLVGINGDNYGGSPGTLVNDHSSVTVNATGCAGGLAYENTGLIYYSSATGAVTANATGCAGGLVGYNLAPAEIELSFATGAVNGYYAGGLVGRNDTAVIFDTYATGKVTGGSSAIVGGLVGLDGTSKCSTTILSSYSTGQVVGGTGSTVGGLIGSICAKASLIGSYWDLTASGISAPSQGTGNVANAPGITGLTTQQFQAGLPAGFDPSIWATSSTINGGYPYLLSNVP